MQKTKKKDTRKVKPYSPKDFKNLSHKEKHEYQTVAGIRPVVFSHEKWHNQVL